jgi:hypothetical protein
VSWLTRIQVFLAGAFLALALVHFGIVVDVDEAAFWLMGVIILSWLIEALIKAKSEKAKAIKYESMENG